MPVYNEEQTLGEIIEAVLKQPLVAELICVDDCSVDGAPRSWKNTPRPTRA